MMKYKGYFGQITEFDDKAGVMHGEVIGLKDVITFQGKTAEELKQAFKNSIEDYLQWCKERKEAPEKTYSGNLRLRMSPDLHAYIALEAARQGISINNYINEKLKK